MRRGIPEHGRIPKYYTVKARLARLVGELGEADPLPTGRDLSEEYEVARETVRQAIRELVPEGKLRGAERGGAGRGRGGRSSPDSGAGARGTVVAGPKLEQPLSLVGCTALRAARELCPRVRRRWEGT